MKRRLIAVALFVAMIVMLCGCEMPPLRNKPEDVVDALMKKDKLVELLAAFDDVSTEGDVDDIGEAFWIDVMTSPSIKSLLLDNVGSISYNITNTTINNDKAIVSTIITHLDMTPVMDKAMEIFFNKVMDLDASGVKVPEDQDELMELLLPIVSQSVKEAITKSKPTDTYTKIKFECDNHGGLWELREIPEDFLEKVLFMNFEQALEDSWNENYSIYQNVG